MCVHVCTHKQNIKNRNKMSISVKWDLTQWLSPLLQFSWRHACDCHKFKVLLSSEISNINMDKLSIGCHCSGGWILFFYFIPILNRSQIGVKYKSRLISLALGWLTKRRKTEFQSMDKTIETTPLSFTRKHGDLQIKKRNLWRIMIAYFQKKHNI